MEYVVAMIRNPRNTMSAGLEPNQLSTVSSWQTGFRTSGTGLDSKYAGNHRRYTKVLEVNKSQRFSAMEISALFI